MYPYQSQSITQRPWMVVLNQVSSTGATASNTQGTVNATMENSSMYSVRITERKIPTVNAAAIPLARSVHTVQPACRGP